MILSVVVLLFFAGCDLRDVVSVRCYAGGGEKQNNLNLQSNDPVCAFTIKNAHPAVLGSESSKIREHSKKISEVGSSIRREQYR